MLTRREMQCAQLTQHPAGAPVRLDVLVVDEEVQPVHSAHVTRRVRLAATGHAPQLPIRRLPHIRNASHDEALNTAQQHVRAPPRGPSEDHVRLDPTSSKTAHQRRASILSVKSSIGSTCEAAVSKRTTFLVTGMFGRMELAHTSYGPKIQRPWGLKRCGEGIIIDLAEPSA